MKTKTYKPAYLYIKTHNVTGLKYFGKTTQDPYKYQGSGTQWCKHIEEYGYDVATELLNEGRPYQNEQDLVEVAVKFSNENNIVSSDIWANKRIENGDGGDTSMCENYKKGIAERNQSGANNPMWGRTSFAKGKTYEEIFGEDKATELKQKRVESATGRKLDEESLKKMAKSISLATKGVTKSEQHKQNMRKPKTEEHKEKLRKPRAKIECPHCKSVGGISQMKRWHFSNCKNKSGDSNENN
jgi:hypothetical protein